jgi:protein TonB
MRTSAEKRRNERLLEKTRYTIRIEIGFILALLIMISLFRMELKPSEEAMLITTVEQETVKMEDIEVTKQISRPPPPPRPIVPVAVSNDEIIIDEEINIDAEFDLDNLTEFEMPAPPEEPEEEAEEQVFVVVEKMPELKGGIAALMKHIRYPEIARKAGLEGRVYVQFIIDERGKVHNPVVVRGIGGGCDEAAIEAVKKVTFTPGLQRGKPVKVKYSLPIMFKLEKSKDMESR